ncbi:hypothetical protein PMI02_04910 [Novosphingobium sp. AP12]|nr:hypothetical protein PMI02_04910 [Novosphingobium sp. AP12]
MLGPKVSQLNTPLGVNGYSSFIGRILRFGTKFDGVARRADGNLEAPRWPLRFVWEAGPNDRKGLPQKLQFFGRVITIGWGGLDLSGVG